MPVSDGMWESIAAQIPVKQEKPKYWMLLLVMLFALPFLLYPLSKGGDQHTENSLDSARVQETAQTNNTKIYSSRADSDKLTERDIEKKSTKAKTSIFSSPTLPLLNKVAVDRVNSNANSRTDRTNYTGAHSSLVAKKSILKSSNKETIDVVSTGISSLNNTGVNWNKREKKLKFLKKSLDTNINSEGPTTTNNFKLIEKSRVFQSATTVKSVTAIQNIFDRNNLSLLNYDRQEDIRKLLGLKKASPVCPSFQAFRSGIYFYVDYKTGLVNQQLENKSNNAEISDLIAQRNQTESGALSSSINLGIGKKWNSGILLESGLNYDAITTTLSYLQPAGAIIVIDSMPPITMDTITTSARMVNSKNRFRQVNIPVNLGYEIALTDRYSLAAKAGILVNLSSTNSGQIIDNDGLVAYDSSERINSLYKTNLNLSYTGGIDFLVEATQNISGYVGLSVNYYPDDFSLSTYAIKQSYYKYGMTAGLRYRL